MDGSFFTRRQCLGLSRKARRRCNSQTRKVAGGKRARHGEASWRSRVRERSPRTDCSSNSHLPISGEGVGGGARPAHITRNSLRCKLLRNRWLRFAVCVFPIENRKLCLALRSALATLRSGASLRSTGRRAWSRIENGRPWPDRKIRNYSILRRRWLRFVVLP
jgi:hypothetical protein